MAKTYGFTEPAVRRIGAGIRRIERLPPPPPRQVRGDAPPPPPEAFWAELTGEAGGGLYSWKLVYFKPDDGTWVEPSPAVTGTDNLRESSNATGLYDAGGPKRFPATFNGYDASTPPVPQYLFTGAAGGEMPVGEFQHQVYQNVSQNQAGFGFTQSHAIP